MVEQTQKTTTNKTTGSRKKSSTPKGASSQAAAKPSRSGSGSKGSTGRSNAAAGNKPASRKRLGISSQATGDQSAAPQRQGDSTTSQGGPATPMFGGTKQVAIEEVPMATRGGRRQGPEPYPFSELPPSRIENGTIIGPSFFVPNDDDPKKIIAAGRKRHKPAGKIFLTRQMDGPSPTDPEAKVSGVRVWLAPPNYNQQ